MDLVPLVFSGSSNLPLAEKICEYLKIPLGKALVDAYSDGETRIELHDNVRGRDVYLIQSTCAPQNHHLMQSLIMVDAARRASAKSINMVFPYFGYGRQERKSNPRTPITAKLIADLYTVAGIDRVLTIDLHAGAIQGFFNMPVDHLFAKPIFVPYFEKQKIPNLIVVSPDAGGVERARSYAKNLNCGIAIIDKRREKPNVSSVMHVVGDVKGKHCLIIDDIVDTAGSLCQAAEALKKSGATQVSAAVTHPVLSGAAAERIQNSPLSELVVTDSIPLKGPALQIKQIVQLTMAELLAKAIDRIQRSDSISSLFI